MSCSRHSENRKFETGRCMENPDAKWCKSMKPNGPRSARPLAVSIRTLQATHRENIDFFLIIPFPTVAIMWQLSEESKVSQYIQFHSAYLLMIHRSASRKL